MYYTVLISSLIGLRMIKVYFSAIAVSATLFFSYPALSDQAGAANDKQINNRQCVVLLHGLARSSRSMEKMEQALLSAGYATANIDYPSRTMKIQDLNTLAGTEGVNQCREKGARTIHFVTHSLGGILARYYLSKNKLPELGHLVQLAPPNKGSLFVDQYRSEHWYIWLTGPAGQQLGTGKDGIPGLLGAVNYSTGVIAGDEHSPIDNWMAEIIPGDDDGKVSVEHAKVDGMSDFIVLPYNHISIMKEDAVISQTLHYLSQGRFNHPGSTN